MKRMGLALTLLILAGPSVDAGVFSKKAKEEVPGGHPQQLVTTNGTVVPVWASKRMQESPVPLYGRSWGRRPWVYPLSTQATPSAVMARADQLGYGAGPVPGYTNGPHGPGANYPMASVGPGNPNGWGPRSGLRNLFQPSLYPIILNTGATGN